MNRIPSATRTHPGHALRTSHKYNARTQWEAKFEQALNVIDPDTASKLMVTTRVRGLIKGVSEVAVGTLSQVDALKLLAAASEVGEYAPPEKGEAEGNDQYPMACEVVELCGRLALTVFVRQQQRLNCSRQKASKYQLKQACDTNGIHPL